ncbi:MAG TPA: amidohydrolase family protein [Solirubrobacterales bacterium]|nr:amidohydrolase family protein [Solirubrobacterales bacterium]
MSDEPSTPTLIDFHGHWFPSNVVDADPAADLPPSVAAVWPLLLDIDTQLRDAAAAGIELKVICAPYSSLAWSAHVPLAEIPARVNDTYAERVAESPDRLAALATIDAFRGDEAAEEVRRAVTELHLPGIVVDASQGERLLSAPEARPTLVAAAELGVPVFAHPVNPPVLPERYAAEKGLGVLLARGAESALSTLHLLRAGVLDELPDLRLVIAGIGAAALNLSVFLDSPEPDAPRPSDARSRLYVDTMGFDAPALRFAVDVVGAEHVVVGSDWPIMWRNAGRDRVEEMIGAAGLDEHDGALVAAGNAADLLGLRRTSSAAAASR